MMEGFFSRQQLAMVKDPSPRVPLCGKCGLLKGCKSPKMPVAGKGKRKILIVGEAPGEHEDEVGKPFVGRAGQRLQQELQKNGISLFEDCWVTNALSCRPPGNKIPKDAMIDYCRPLVSKAIDDLKPRTIILLGGKALASVIRPIFKDKMGSVGRWMGWHIPWQRWNCWLCPVVHPSWLLRKEREGNPPATREFAEHIAAAVKHKNKPYEELPRYEDRVSLIMNTSEVSNAIKEFTKRNRPLAFDYETNCLKPHGKNAEILCCSVSDGDWSIAYPWHGPAITATLDMLKNPEIKKMGWNAKFEHEWTLVKHGVRTRGWIIDGMTSVHALDARPEICGLKFQAFMRLGIEDYDSHIEEYKKPAEKGAGNNGINRMKELPIRQLLKYCALDSLYEALIDKSLRKEFA